MKRKTIKAVLAKKHAEFVESIKDEEVQRLVQKNAIITGGCITSMLLNEKVNDFDYYFTNKETVLAVARYYVDEFNKRNDYNARVEEMESGRVRVVVQSQGIAAEEGFEDTESEDEPATLFEDDESTVGELKEKDGDKYRPVFLSSNAITLTGKIQLVLRFYGEPDEIHENYDYAHTKCYWRAENGHLDLPASALEAILAKELIYTGSKYPLASIIRSKKFVQRGWRINAGQFVKMALHLNEMDLKDPNVLEEQLTGVDFAYFQAVINSIKKRMEEDEHFKLDNAYLFEVINRIFD
ncbi:hypothetical protein DFP93_101308 [Aneurinibacillus soli]|uniref:Uncharacterized protein n=1 Tax=Aneurinibacillus soli TaxID=1500254 RepID=A0A0U5BDE9_9BACL|nr:hypothetical protein [Aneurinibacillus soli]PYE64282.1 hypothetical protein DFP93_101308 [Aneurinibacillus soli]BAU28231.1 hypothetical protein CB4_02405 [Aneurinibacillus soli]